MLEKVFPGGLSGLKSAEEVRKSSSKTYNAV
jgi:hypothetical protein